MIYRRALPGGAPRLLLRIAAAAGSATVAAAVGACSSDAGIMGSAPCAGHLCGSVVMVADGGDAGEDASPGPCGGNVCGVIVMPPDAGADG